VSSSSPASDRRAAGTAARLAPIAALFIVALALRPQLSSIGPMADSIITDLGVGHAYVGLLTAIPVVCMGLFAVLGPAVAPLTGVRAGIALSVAVLLVFALLRALVPGAVGLLLLTFGVGVGTGTVGPLLPMFVRGRLPAQVVAGTAAYAGGTITGAALGSGVVVPLESLLGGWQQALAAISLLSSLALVAWLLLVRGLPTAPEADRPPRRFTRPRLPVRRPIAWLIGILFAMQSWLFYGTLAWLAPVYEERGWTPLAAAGLVTLVNATSLLAIVLVPWLSGRGLSRRTLLVTTSLLAATGLTGVSVAPDGALVWAVTIGLGLGMAFTLILTLPVDIASEPAEVGGAAALMFLVGYLLASVAPFVLGAIRDATGDFALSVWLLVAIAAVMAPLCWSLNPKRLRPLVPAPEPARA
jgi:CP family cyanate transporter-like MFS transporter